MNWPRLRSNHSLYTAAMFCALRFISARTFSGSMRSHLLYGKQILLSVLSGGKADLGFEYL
jgi:hypothetical protein